MSETINRQGKVLPGFTTFAMVCAAALCIATQANGQFPGPGDMPSLPSPDKQTISQENTPSDSPQDSSSANGDGIGDGEVSVSSYLTVDLHVQDTDLADVLKMLSIQSHKNIIMSRNVAATVTADLYDVTFYEALDAILNANGYGYREKGNFIYVYTLDEIKALDAADRQLTHKRFVLNYLNAADASTFVTPLLSDDGSIAINGEVGTGIDPDTGDVGATSWANSATIVVSDYAENVDQIEIMLKELDTRPQQVLVEATVLQTKLTEDNAWGVDWSIVSDLDFSNFGNPLSGVGDLLKGSDSGFQPANNSGFVGGTNVGNVAGPGSLKIGVISNDISVFLRVLDQASDTTVLSRPKILALNRQRGEILVGAQIGYLSSTATSTSTTQSVEFLDTGTKLLFRPFIANDGFVRMELAPSVSEGVIRQVTTAGGDAVTIPDRITQELTTNVVVRDGNTIVLGGLFKEQTDLSRTQVPVLGDIPLIGAAFKGRTDTTVRQEITFLITPTIMKDEYQADIGRAAAQGVLRSRLAARKGTLWWSNDRLTSQHNMRAEKYMREGNTEKALWEIENSLSLKADQPEVYRLKEEITGEHDRWFDRSLIKSLVDDAISEQLGQVDEMGAVNTPDEFGQSDSSDATTLAEVVTQDTAMMNTASQADQSVTDLSLSSEESSQMNSEFNNGEFTTYEEVVPNNQIEIPLPSDSDSSFNSNSSFDSESTNGSTASTNSELDLLTTDFGFDIEEGVMTDEEFQALHGAGDAFSQMQPAMNEVAMTGQGPTQTSGFSTVPFMWFSMQRLLGIHGDNSLEPSVAEVPTDTPEK